MGLGQTITREAFMTRVSVAMGKDFTDEQLNFASNFMQPVLSKSLPGTGKTTSAVLGLLVAELYDKVRGENIYALSFTRMATMELRHRHEDEARKLGIKSTPNFRTLSSICREILMNNYAKLGFSNLTISKSFTIKELSTFLMETAEYENIPMNKYRVRDVVRAIRSLNSSLVFDRPHVESKMAFKKTKLEYEDFQKLRKAAYDLNKVMECIQLDDILLYTLELLIKNPEVVVELKRKIRLLLIDEIQDMSLLQLKIISFLSDNVVGIGDIRQQIYAFNGACQEVFEKFIEYFPNTREVELTQSFRCGAKIADYATSLVVHNGTGGEEFKGKPGLDGLVKFHPRTNIKELCEKIKDDYEGNRHVFPKDIMFIFRNNFSSIPIGEELFHYRVPFRINNYTPAHQIPIVQDLCALTEIIRNPNSPNTLDILKKVVPEFQKHDTVRDIPHHKIMTSTGEGFFDIKFKFKDEAYGLMFTSAMQEAKELYDRGAPLSEVFDALMPAYEPWLNDNGHWLEQDPQFYLNLVSPLIQNKTYQQFTSDELKKEEFINENNEKRKGLRCYTMHAAKGTEADIIHIIDAVEGIVPNTSKLKDMVDNDCVIDAAREIRNERCLVYVASTRAKEELHVHHSGPLASIFSGINTFKNLDAAYDAYKSEYRDVEIFEAFTA